MPFDSPNPCTCDVHYDEINSWELGRGGAKVGRFSQLQHVAKCGHSRVQQYVLLRLVRNRQMLYFVETADVQRRVDSFKSAACEPFSDTVSTVFLMVFVRLSTVEKRSPR